MLASVALLTAYAAKSKHKLVICALLTTRTGNQLTLISIINS